jgi:hypothetical protein
MATFPGSATTLTVTGDGFSGIIVPSIVGRVRSFMACRFSRGKRFSTDAGQHGQHIEPGHPRNYVVTGVHLAK